MPNTCQRSKQKGSIGDTNLILTSDVAVGKPSGCYNASVLDCGAVVLFVSLLESLQNDNGRQQARFLDENLLEPPLERSVLLNVTAVFVKCGGADTADATASQRRLQHVGAVHVAARDLAGAEEHVDLVDEEDHLAVGALRLLDHLLDAVLEHAAQHGPGHHRAEVDLHDARSRERGGDIPRRNTLCNSLGYGRLADPGAPTSMALFLVRRQRTQTTRSISSSRPMTGSVLPAAAVMSRPYAAKAHGFVLGAAAAGLGPDPPGWLAAGGGGAGRGVSFGEPPATRHKEAEVSHRWAEVFNRLAALDESSKEAAEAHKMAAEAG